MTHFIFAYDTERSKIEEFRGTRLPSCFEGCKPIADLHRKNNAPANFFITGETLEKDPAAYKSLLDDDLFEIGSHTYSHKKIMYHGVWGAPASDDEIREEIFRGKEIVERVFGRPCSGLRPGWGFIEEQMKMDHKVLGLIRDAGYEYVSSVLWGADYTLPAPLKQSFTYRDSGFPGIREFPGHGWHDNVLRGQLRIWGIERLRLLCFPPVLPEAVPADYVGTPEEEFAVYKALIDRALKENLMYVSFIMHPWSLYLFDPGMKILDLTMRYAKSRGMTLSTFGALNTLLNEQERA